MLYFYERINDDDEVCEEIDWPAHLWEQTSSSFSKKGPARMTNKGAGAFVSFQADQTILQQDQLAMW